MTDIRLIPVLDTYYKEYFEGHNPSSIFLLDKKHANYAWDNNIYQDCTSYFDLPDKCWIVAKTSYTISDWMKSYNGDSAIVSENLRLSVSWNENSIITFFANRNVAFKSKWSEFVTFWDDFISIEDDCPIIVPEKNSKKEALLFRPVGNIIKIG